MEKEILMSCLSYDQSKPFTLLNLIDEENLNELVRDCNFILGSSLEERGILTEMRLE